MITEPPSIPSSKKNQNLDEENDVPSTPDSSSPQPRRSFLTLLTCASTLTGTAALSWPFLKSLTPNLSEETESVDVDISALGDSQAKTVIWAGKPIFIIKRNAQQLSTLQQPELINSLRDPESKENQQPDYARNWHRSLKPEIGVMVGICTHLGCVPFFQATTPPSSDQAKKNLPKEGYNCACHGSFYDLAGRVFKGVPAPFNLPVPPYYFPQPHLLRIGTNPPGESFNLHTIKQL